MLVSGTEEGELYLWDMDSYNLQATIKGKYISLSFNILYISLSCVHIYRVSELTSAKEKP